MIWDFGFVLIANIDSYGEESKDILAYSDSEEELLVEANKLQNEWDSYKYECDDDALLEYMGSYLFDNERGLNVSYSSLEEWLENNPIPDKIKSFVSIDKRGLLIFDEDPLNKSVNYTVEEIGSKQ